MLEFLRNAFTGLQEGINALVSSVVDFVKWIGLALDFGQKAIFYVPVTLAPVCLVVGAIYLLKIVVGGENK